MNKKGIVGSESSIGFGWGTVIATLLVGLAVGIVFGTVYQAGLDFSYQKSAVMTCNYANDLTYVINLQSETLKFYTGTDYTAIDYLNCSFITS